MKLYAVCTAVDGGFGFPEANRPSLFRTLDAAKEHVVEDLLMYMSDDDSELSEKTQLNVESVRSLTEADVSTKDGFLIGDNEDDFSTTIYAVEVQ